MIWDEKQLYCIFGRRLSSNNDSILTWSRKSKSCMILTNILEFKCNGWIFKMHQKRTHLFQPLSPFDPDQINKQKLYYHWEPFCSWINVHSWTHWNTDWWLFRIFCFAKASFHVAVNIWFACISTMIHWEDYTRSVEVMCEHPRHSITAQNAVDLEDDNLSSQYNHNV